MTDFEILIENNKVIGVNLEISQKYKFHKIYEIKDTSIINKINNIRKWLHIHSLGNYIMNSKEYEDYKEFMEQKRYLINTSNVINPLKEKLKLL